jgi:Recombinase
MTAGCGRPSHGIAWSKSAVRAILTNPRYTGFQVWNRQRKQEILLDVDDVALGHETKMRWNDRQAWLRSTEPSHPAIVTVEAFQPAQDQLAAAGRRSKPRMPRPTPRPYQLRGLLFCGICQRRMQGNFNHGLLHYRCRFPNEYALANRVEHPRVVAPGSAVPVRPPGARRGDDRSCRNCESANRRGVRGEDRRPARPGGGCDLTPRPRRRCSAAPEPAPAAGSAAPATSGPSLDTPLIAVRNTLTIADASRA